MAAAPQQPAAPQQQEVRDVRIRDRHSNGIGAGIMVTAVLLALLVGIGGTLLYFQSQPKVGGQGVANAAVTPTTATVAENCNCAPAPAQARAVAQEPAHVTQTVTVNVNSPQQQAPRPAPQAQAQVAPSRPAAKAPAQAVPKPVATPVPSAVAGVCPNGYSVAVALWNSEAKKVAVGGVTLEQYVESLKAKGGHIKEDTSLRYGAALRQAANAGTIQIESQELVATLEIGSRSLGTVTIGGSRRPVDFKIGEFKPGEEVAITISGGNLFSPWEQGKRITLTQTPTDAQGHSCKKMVHVVK